MCSDGKWVEPQTKRFKSPQQQNDFSGIVAYLTVVDHVIYRENRRYIARDRRFFGISPKILPDWYFSMKYHIDTLRYTTYRDIFLLGIIADISQDITDFLGFLPKFCRTDISPWNIISIPSNTRHIVIFSSLVYSSMKIILYIRLLKLKK